MNDTTQITDDTLLVLTADITAAFASNNTVTPDELPGVITSIHGALAGLGQPAPSAKPVPAVEPRKSIKPDGLISLIDGKPYKMLKRHLGLHGYTPETYRAAFDLPHDYPMTAPNYAILRRDLAKRIGLGRHANAGRGRKKAA